MIFHSRGEEGDIVLEEAFKRRILSGGILTRRILLVPSY